MVTNNSVLNLRRTPKLTNTIVLNERSPQEVSRNLQENSGDVRTSQTTLFLISGGLRKFPANCWRGFAGGERFDGIVLNVTILKKNLFDYGKP